MLQERAADCRLLTAGIDRSKYSEAGKRRLALPR
jgi:hypothetical protein